jgi:predicted phage baseplate assembly protein
VLLSGYAEVLWYANAPDPSQPTKPPTGSTPGIPLIVATLTVAAHSGANLGGYGSMAPEVTVQAGWTDVGILLSTPVATLLALPSRLTLARPPAAAAGVATTAIIEDANGNGAAVTATPSVGSSDVTMTADGTVPPLQAPVRILWDLIGITRGKTIRDEALGVGDATQAGQDFTLSNAPVTYLADAPGRSGDGYSSTVVLTVDGQYWTEVPMLYGYGPGEPVFETYQDDTGQTHVRTGTGETGRRLPSGAKVSATYRVGSGAAVPAAGALSQVLTAVPNLRSVRNPVPPVGGADPEASADVRTLAPRSVLTFGRAISGDDYATVAGAAPGVTRATAVWEWDAAEQRPAVRVYVGDDAGAVASAKTALAAQADPNRPLVVLPAVPCPAGLAITLRLDPSYVAATVYAAVSAALIDGLFARGVLALGEPLYRSRIEEIVCAIPGVLATHHMRLVWRRDWFRFFSSGPRFDPGGGGFFTLTAADLSLSEEVDADD